MTESKPRVDLRGSIAPLWFSLIHIKSGVSQEIKALFRARRGLADKSRPENLTDDIATTQSGLGILRFSASGIKGFNRSKCGGNPYLGGMKKNVILLLLLETT
jgi:hypothetical protein